MVLVCQADILIGMTENQIMRAATRTVVSFMFVAAELTLGTMILAIIKTNLFTLVKGQNVIDDCMMTALCVLHRSYYLHVIYFCIILKKFIA
jgi:hypothetical protein